MIREAVLLGVGFSTIMGCAIVREFAPQRAGTIYELRVMPGFTESEQQTIEDAAQEWEDATVGLRIDVTRRPCESPLPVAVACIAPRTRPHLIAQGCRPDNDPVACTSRSPLMDASFIGIDVDDILPGKLGRVVLHELGHAMGMEHDEDLDHEGLDVMIPWYRLSSDHLTCLDVESFWRVRETEGTCKVAASP